MRYSVIFAAIVLIITGLSGCSSNTMRPSGAEDVSAELVTEAFAYDAAPELVFDPAPAPALMPKGSGEIRYAIDTEEEIQRLDADQERLLLDYMDLYYQSLADLMPGDPTALFAGNARDQALTRQSAWRVMVDVRKAQQVDLGLAAFSYELTVTGINEGEGGVVSVSAGERSVQNFIAFPGVDSESYNIRHRFSLARTAEGWRLRSHSQMDSANMVAIGRSMWRASSRDDENAEEDVAAALSRQYESVLKSHAENLALRALDAGRYDSDADSGLAWDHDYDRVAAVDYAMDWVQTRNEDQWPTYDRNGGNCANYASQCLLAGGIPMDYFGYSQWKWYGGTPNSAQSALGRSAAWSGVDEFYTYVTNNTGYGMVTQPDANYWAGEPGDLIQLGYSSEWRHVVVIVEVIKDDAGNPVDYLINSNTADLRNFPVSAYLYPNQRLIKIHGWSEG